jgi:hypothetical protein
MTFRPRKAAFKSIHGVSSAERAKNVFSLIAEGKAKKKIK